MEQQERFAGVRLPDPGFAGDDGSADPALAGALAEHAAGALSSRDVVAALAGARLLVPVVAVLDEAEVGADGLRRDKDSHMATVSLLNPDGRRGLLAFTSTVHPRRVAVRRPPRGSHVAAGGAGGAAGGRRRGASRRRRAGAAAPIEGAALQALAAGTAWHPAHRDPEVHSAVRALAGVTLLTLRDGSEHGCDLLVLVAGAGEDALGALADRLAADPALQLRCPRGIAVALIRRRPPTDRPAAAAPSGDVRAARRVARAALARPAIVVPGHLHTGR